jgi:hypothetical protein
MPCALEGTNMLIKLNGGVQQDPRGFVVEAGMKFLRYLRDGSYDKGEVVEITDREIVVDFLDMIRSFPRSEVTLVFGEGNDEHLMFLGEGTMIKDFRGTGRAPVPQFDTFEDLLDFDKWMV